MSPKFAPYGKHWRSSRLLFSLLPRCHALCGSQKHTLSLVSMVKRAGSATSRPCFEVSVQGHRQLGNTARAPPRGACGPAATQMCARQHLD